MSDTPTCSICEQPFRDGEEIDRTGGYLGLKPWHEHTADCIAAVVRWCEEIAQWESADEIRREFPEVFKD